VLNEEPVPFHLASFVPQFDQLCLQKFGRPYDLVALESSFCDLASGKRHLTAKDVGKLFNAESTPYGKYWSRPHMKTLEEALREKRINLKPTGTDRQALIENLLSVFHNIGTVSLLLRFVHRRCLYAFSLDSVKRPVSEAAKVAGFVTSTVARVRRPLWDSNCQDRCNPGGPGMLELCGYSSIVF
jgi:hypothetical protein